MFSEMVGDKSRHYFKSPPLPLRYPASARLPRFGTIENPYFCPIPDFVKPKKKCGKMGEGFYSENENDPARLFFIQLLYFLFVI